MKQKCLALLVAGGLLCSTLMGCTRTYATDLMDGVKAGTPTEVQVQEETWTGMYDFSVKLLQTTCDREDNTLVSPMSVLSALAMTANGAQGETRTQMEEILGGSVEQLNGALTGLGQENDSPLYLANSIWFAEEGRITPNPDFLQINADYYRAGVFEAPFDQTTVTDINRWVKEHTHGMVEEMGMVLPFDSAQADFTGLGTSPEGNLFINQVFHKAYLEVQETGTRGGAATAVEINCEGAFQEPEDQKVVTLDRPFVYLVVDTSSMLPVFMGTVLSV